MRSISSRAPEFRLRSRGKTVSEEKPVLLPKIAPELRFQQILSVQLIFCE